jgi:hypothetical protein
MSGAGLGVSVSYTDLHLIILLVTRTLPHWYDLRVLRQYQPDITNEVRS